MSGERWVTGSEIATEYNVSRNTVKEWIKTDWWPQGRDTTRHGRKRVEYPISAVDAQLAIRNLPDRGRQSAMLVIHDKSLPTQEA